MKRRKTLQGYNAFFKFVVMPFCGRSLDAYAGKLCYESFVRICYQSHCGLRQLHDLGFIHRDLKPDNFIVGGE